MKDYLITNCTIVKPDSLLENHTVEIRDGLIHKIHIVDEIQAMNLPVIDGNAGYLTVGLVEMHIHGCGPYCTGQLNDHVISNMKNFLKNRGINTFLPTMPYYSPTYQRTLDELKSLDQPEHEIPGIYLEGPFIIRDKKGGIQEHNITEGNTDVLNRIIRDSDSRLAMMTVAPECRDFILLAEILKKNGIICALGHSNCDISKRGSRLAPPPVLSRISMRNFPS